MPALNQLVQKSHNGTPYPDLVHFVHVYIVEAHPKAPDISPYNGSTWPMTYSDYGQPKTYDGRVQNAKAMEALLEGDPLVLVDDLTPGPRNNPVWCTYGTCPNCSFLIGQDGIIVETLDNTSNKLSTLETALQGLLN